jgi:hypothetical protein
MVRDHTKQPKLAQLPHPAGLLHQGWGLALNIKGEILDRLT